MEIGTEKCFCSALILSFLVIYFGQGKYWLLAADNCLSVHFHVVLSVIYKMTTVGIFHQRELWCIQFYASGIIVMICRKIFHALAVQVDSIHLAIQHVFMHPLADSSNSSHFIVDSIADRFFKKHYRNVASS